MRSLLWYAYGVLTRARGELAGMNAGMYVGGDTFPLTAAPAPARGPAAPSSSRGDGPAALRPRGGGGGAPSLCRVGAGAGTGAGAACGSCSKAPDGMGSVLILQWSSVARRRAR